MPFINRNEMVETPVLGTHIRDKFPDMLRGVAVILMIQVHITEVFATDQFRDGFWGQLSLFLGGLAAAPVFMFLMGWFAVGRSSDIKLFLRGMLVFFAGFLLNIGLNLALIANVLLGSQVTDLWPYLFGVDIFSLAGLSLMVISGIRLLVSRLGHFVSSEGTLKWILTLLPFVIVSIGMLMPSGSFQESDISVFIKAYIWRDTQWWSYFPLFPWLAWPLLGGAFRLWAGGTEIPDLKGSIVSIAGIGAIIGCIYGWSVSVDLASYYRFNLAWFVWAIMAMIVWFWFWKRMSNVEWLSNGLSSIGAKVSSLYVIQWIIIGNMGTFLYHEQPDRSIPFWIAFTLFLTLFVRSLPDRISKWREKDWF